jgi:uridylate kinase
MILGCKLSGELLSQNGTESDVWTTEGIMRATEIVGALQRYVSEPNDHGANGAFIVVGAGNGGFRGRELTEKYGMKADAADRIGLMGTIMNAQVLAGALADAAVPHDLWLPNGIKLTLPDFEPKNITPERAHVAFRAGRVAVVGGGSGEYGQSTDGAIITHLAMYRGLNDDPVMAFKSTEFGGVYPEDPRTVIARGEPLPPRYRSISTGAIRQYGHFAVDRAGVDLIEHSGVPMMLHGFDTTPVEALETGLGTLIEPDRRVSFAYV